jgi:hypothetical protein
MLKTSANCILRRIFGKVLLWAYDNCVQYLGGPQIYQYLNGLNAEMLKIKLINVFLFQSTEILDGITRITLSKL